MQRTGGRGLCSYKVLTEEKRNDKNQSAKCCILRIHKKAGAECQCGSLDSLLDAPLTPGICQTINSLMGGELVFVTCERSYSNDLLPSSLAGEV